MEHALAPYRRYFDFQGRSRRAEYWLFQLFQLVAVLLLVVIGGIASTAFGKDSPIGTGIAGLCGLLMFGILLGSIIPSLSVFVRRLHDSDKSGWFILFAFIPFGGIVLLVFCCLDGTPGPNRYGPDPKGRGGAQTAAVFS